LLHDLGAFKPPRALSRVLAHLLAKLRVYGNLLCCLVKRLKVARGAGEAVLAVLDKVSTTLVFDDTGATAGQGLERDVAKSLYVGGEEEHVCAGIGLSQRHSA